MADQVDDHLVASRAGLRTLWGSFAVLLATALIQAVVVALTGSVALLSDTLHNAADALSALPLAVAFTLGRRAATARFTYGFGRAEDLAGLAVVALIAASAALAAVESARRLAEPRPLQHAGAVAAAALVGFLGNEAVARWRVRVGRRIGSAALVADGLHARADGFTSLAVLVAAGGGALGWPWVDPAVGLAVAAAILWVLVGAGRQVLGRLMDAVEPQAVATATRLAAATPGVLAVEQVRLRWSGHGRLAELTVVVDRDASLLTAHGIAHEVEHRLLHGVHRLVRAHVHPHPAPLPGTDDHAVVAHHARS
ncbi:cation diffusion facilitator family transporter [Streptoalloteichus hindustanus]|uniref:Cation diffusion facilitator family transporter n=1 Tax=Streptoalloteichus hindustanus TaxID=2017 RepID=A0A1M5B2I9_STRHI|nr:cation diffusion facilitator family transporter [Streptoalloteichus hindustanus]SHF36402.1 cation diffusion facilitator family transporter [Streptoalloteichus hindustanus]